MRRITLFLSGEYPEISKAEARGVLEAEGWEFDVVEEHEQVLIIETNANPTDLAKRLGMCHWIGENFATAKRENIKEAISNSDIIDFLSPARSLAIRTKKIRNSMAEMDTQKLTKEIADTLLERFDYEINLEIPDNEIYILLSDGKCIVSLILARVDRRKIRERRPPKRAAVHPSTLQPFFARAMVNLARTPRNGTFMDPFCGVGGILLEAGLIGAKVRGIDIKEKQIEGAERNLSEHNIRDFELSCEDMRKTNIRKRFDAIATDPPYGRQASTGGADIRGLYEEALPVLSEMLKDGRFLCLTAPSQIEIPELTKNLDLKILEKYRNRVHKDLTRIIYVLRKNRKQD